MCFGLGSRFSVLLLLLSASLSHVLQKKICLHMIWAALERRVRQLNPREPHCFSNGELVNTKGGVANINADEPLWNLS